MKKKLLCLVLAMAMILTIMPAQAFADYSTGWQSIGWGNIKEFIEGLITKPEQKKYNVYYTGEDGQYATIEVADGARLVLINHNAMEYVTVNGADVYVDPVTYEGFVFVGWDVTKVGNSYAFYSVWEKEAAPEYTVYYNNESGHPDALDVSQDAQISFYTKVGNAPKAIKVTEDTVIDPMTYSDPRYVFIGWSPIYISSTSYMFVAHWDYKDTVTVTFKDASGNTSSAAFNYGDELEFCIIGDEVDISYTVGAQDINVADISGLNLASPSFKGWDRKGKVFTGVWDKGVITYKSADTLENATMSAIVGTPYYLVNGNETDEYTVAATTTIKDLTATGKAFRGWTVKEDATGYLTFNAVWSFNTGATITYTQNKGAQKITGTTIAAVTGTSITINATNGTYDGKSSSTKQITANITLDDTLYKAPAGYEFNGWRCTIDDKGNMTFTAVLKQASYTLTYKSAVNKTTTSKAIGYGDTVTIFANGGQYYGQTTFTVTTNTAINNPNYPGKTFVGWVYKYNQGNDIYSNKIYLTAKYSEITTGAAYSYCAQDKDCYIVSQAGIEDVAATSWAHDGIHFVLEKGLMTKAAGTTTGAFKFNSKSAVTRAEVIAALYGLENDVKVVVATGTDLHTTLDSAKLAAAETWVKKNGIFLGDENGALNGDAKITRQDLTVALMRYAAHFYEQLDENTLASLTFKDGVAISSYAKRSISWAVQTGVMLGFEDGRFNPKGDVTREQLATILVRMYEMYDTTDLDL